MQQSIQEQNLVALTIEGFGTSLVGAYGSNTAMTPNLDRLAARGMVLDQCFLDSFELKSQLISLWSGSHALQRPEPSELTGPWTIWRHCIDSQLPACLVTDSPQVAQWAEWAGCPEVMLVPVLLNTAPVPDSFDCSATTLFAAAAEEIAAGRTGLVWIHSSGFRLPWDAPTELRARFIDDEDPDPPTDVGPPDVAVNEKTDPDLIVGWGQVAAAQAAVIDQSIAVLVATIAARDDSDSWSWLVASLGGVPLGEHGRIGWGVPQLYSEELSLMAILAPSRFASVGERRPELFQLPDLTSAMLVMLKQHNASESLAWGRSCFELSFSDSPQRWPKIHQLACVEFQGHHWIRCPAWSALFEAEKPPQLFVKPDDRWEVSDVANRRHHVVEELEQLVVHFRTAAVNSARGQWPDLPEELTNLLR